MPAQMRVAVAEVAAAADEARHPLASPTRFAPDSPAAASSKPTLPMQARVARRGQRTPPRMKERRSPRNFQRVPVPARLPIHFYCKARLARASLETAPADSGRTVWCQAIRLGKVGKVRAEDAADQALGDPVVDKVARAASADQAAEAECLAELPAEAEAAECLVGAAD